MVNETTDAERRSDPTDAQFARLCDYPPQTSWACVVGMMIVMRQDGKPPDIIDQFGRDRNPLWRELS